MEGAMEGPEAVQRATELIEQRLAQEEETEVRAEVKGAPVKGRELQVKESTCTAVGRERLTAMWVHNMLNRYFLPPPQACFHTRMILTGLWVGRDGAWRWQTFPRPCPIHLTSGDRLDCTGKTRKVLRHTHPNCPLEDHLHRLVATGE